jgi:hypothetical protein
MNDLTNGSMRSELTKAAAIRKAREQGYCFREGADRAPSRSAEIEAQSAK